MFANPMKAKIFLLLACCPLLLGSCNWEKEVGPEYYTYPQIGGELSSPEGRVPSTEKVTVQGNVRNQYGDFYVQVKYDVVWTDDNGNEQTKQQSTSIRYYNATTASVFYTTTLPRQNPGCTVYWSIVATNEYGLTTATTPKSYTVYKP